MKNGLKKILIGVGIVVVLVFAIYRFFAGNYNTIVELDEGVNKQWANVETQYQRRADLIPNLVATVQGYATHENQTLVAVIQARSNAQNMSLSPSDLQDEKKFKEYQAAQNELSAGIRSIYAVAEAYPDLKANENFLALQDQLEGTENRIAVARTDYNTAVQNYNVFIRKFPQSIIANMNGFLVKQMFTASAGAEVAPTVQFN